MKTLYVVTGTTGEYSDRSEWLVRAYLSETEAEAHAEKAGAKAAELFATRSNKYRSPPEGSNEHDPRMQMDYTGTTYFVQEVDAEI